MSRPSMGRRRRASWDEDDAFHPYWRRVLCYLDRPGVRKSIKRKTHKRERREARAEVIEQLREDLDNA